MAPPRDVATLHASLQLLTESGYSDPAIHMAVVRTLNKLSAVYTSAASTISTRAVSICPIAL